MKPKVFIGSSREGVKIADAIHANLTYEAECTVWKDGVFQLSTNTLAELIRVLRDSDFGVFVFSPDDLSIMRGQTANVVRDNVLFELGLFLGRLGPERCFFLVPDDASDLRLPTDLSGITPGRYESGRSDNNWMAALNPACMQIKLQMAKLKPFQDVPVPESEDAPAPAKVAKPSVAAGTRKSTTGSKQAPTISAKYYKRSILVTGETTPHKEKIKEVGGSWNQSLGGWVVPKSREAMLVKAFPKLKVDPASD